MTDVSLSSGSPPDFRRNLHGRHARALILIHLMGVVGFWYAWQTFAGPANLTLDVWGWVVAPEWYTLVFAYAYYRICHYSISIGAHRLYAHTAFEAKRVVHYILVILFAGVVQGPILWWSGKHRLHHARTDKAEDPHSRALRGFFYSHMGWLFTEEGTAMPPPRYTAHFVKRKDRYRAVWWQKDNYRWLSPLMAYGVPVAVCSLWGDPLGGLLVGGFLRLVVQYHTTWAINSVTHGGKEEGGTAQNVGWLVYGAVGEGYHKNHHDEPLAWRFGKWDPSAYILMGLSKLGLVTLPPPRATH